MRTWSKRLVSTFRPRPADLRLEQEMAAHLSALEEEYRRQGMEPAEARLAAKRAFGPMQQIKEVYRERRGFAGLEQLGRDLVFGLRNLRHNPGFSAVALLSLAFGIGVNAAIFTLLNALVLKTLPVPHPERVVEVQAFNRPLNDYQNFFSYPFYRELGRKNTIFEAITAEWGANLHLGRPDGSRKLDGMYVSGTYFSFLHAKPYLGRLLRPDDDGKAGEGRVCVLSYKLWHSVFGADAAIVGKAILLDDKPVQVVGVTGPDFTGLSLADAPDFEVPMAALNYLQPPMNRDSPHMIWLQILAKLKPGIGLREASRQLGPLAARIAETLPKDRPDAGITEYRLRAAPRGFDRWTAMAQPLVILMSTVALVLLIACLNLANLLLARGQEREREIATRLSLGATRWRVVRQLLIENLYLAAGGAIVGLGLANVLVQFLLAEFNRGKTYGRLDVSPDPRVLGFTAAIAGAAVLLFGVVPAWIAARTDARGSVQRAPATRRLQGRTSRLRHCLFVVQVVLTMVLLFGAALFERTLRNLRSIDVAADPEHLVLASLSPEGALGSNGLSVAFLNELRDRVSAMSGVVSVAYGAPGPLSGAMLASSIDIPGKPQASSSALQSFWSYISPNYFQTLGLPLLAGRDFSPADREGAPNVAIVNQKFAATYFPGQNPLGKQFRGGLLGTALYTIVGVARNLPTMHLPEDRKSIVYTPMLQGPRDWQILTVRVRGNPGAFEHQLADLIHALAPSLPLDQFTTMAVQRDANIARHRMLALLSTMFGALALALSAVGLYGLVSYSVARRTREIGIRMSVGARPGDVIGFFLREHLMLIVAGAVMGSLLAFAGDRFVRNLLYGVPATDLTSLYIAAGLLFFVALAATLIPASRATRVDPSEALRAE